MSTNLYIARQFKNAIYRIRDFHGGNVTSINITGSKASTLARWYKAAILDEASKQYFDSSEFTVSAMGGCCFVNFNSSGHYGRGSRVSFDLEVFKSHLPQNVCELFESAVESGDFEPQFKPTTQIRLDAIRASAKAKLQQYKALPSLKSNFRK